MFVPLKGGLYKRVGSSTEVEFSSRLIVKTKRDVEASDLLSWSDRATKATDLFVLAKQRYFLLAFASEVDMRRALANLERNPNILLVQPDLRQKRFLSRFQSDPLANVQNDPVYLDLAKKKNLWPGTGGEGVRVAVIDDGFQLSHPELRGLRTRLHYDFQTHQLVEDSAIGLSTSHGTKIAGVLFGAQNNNSPEGLIPHAQLIAISHSDTWTSETLQSFYLSALSGADVINCSWHSRWLLEPVKDVIDDLSEFGRGGKGIPVIFAAGNEGVELVGQHEASIPSALVVGATDIHGRILKSSNYGSLVDVWVPTEKILSTDLNGGYSYFAGTSLAAAIATGYVALIIQADPMLNVAQIQHQLTQLLDQ